MKILHLILAAVFVLFAYFQANDPDPYGWMLLYFFVALTLVLTAYRRNSPYLLWAGVAVCLVWMSLLLPAFLDWVQMGMPNIAGQMKAEQPYVEFTREFLGLLLCLLAFGWQLFFLRKSKNATPARSADVS